MTKTVFLLFSNWSNNVFIIHVAYPFSMIKTIGHIIIINNEHKDNTVQSNIFSRFYYSFEKINE